MNFGTLDLSFGIVRAGGAVSPPPPEELLTDRQFAEGFTHWLTPGAGNGWSAVDGWAVHTPGNISILRQMVAAIVIGGVYRLQAEVQNRTAGSIRLRLGTTTNLSTLAANQIHDVEVTAPAAGEFELNATAVFDGRVRIISFVRIG